MENPNDLKVFALAAYGGEIVASRGGNGPSPGGTYMGNDGTAYTPGINPGGESQYGEATGINPGGYNKGQNSITTQILDVDGNPLTSAHLKWTENGSSKGTITDANGEATVTVANPGTVVTISYMGKRPHVAAFKDLGSMITLQNNVNNLPPVVVKPQPTVPTKPVTTTTEVKKTNLVKTAAIGIGALLLIGALTKKSKGKSGLNGSAEGLNGPKGKKKKKGKKGKKNKGLRQPVEITI